ncbi:MAG: excinuclease ABC subunit A [Candidatus Amoebophilus sp. 36-38]|nr:MAG: excinuclease ABC subunit A [Candidatus Amoebophilus sp. 36-38]
MSSYGPSQELDKLDPRHFVIVQGARVNNLKNLSVAIPRNQLVVITGLSGSGKSSLAFDTIFAEGQRMYIESLSSYARQFLGKLEKPAVDYIRGISPAIAIEQKTNNKNPRSTVGTLTEIYEYLKLLYARIGITYSPISGQEVTKDTVSDVVDYIYSHPTGTKILVSYPLQLAPGTGLLDRLKIELAKGFTRVIYQGQIAFIEDLLNNQQERSNSEVCILIDRFVVDQQNRNDQSRIADSVQTAFFEGKGTCYVEIVGQEKKVFSDRFERDGMTFEIPSVNLFSFNNSYGACKTCDGFGQILGIDPEKVIPNRALSVYEGAIYPWKSQSMAKWIQPLLEDERYKNFPIHRPYKDLTPEQQDFLWKGDGFFEGINGFFNHLEEKIHKIQNRIFLSRYKGKTICPDCQGTRIRKDASYVKIEGRPITELLLMPIEEVSHFFQDLKLPTHAQQIADRLLIEIKNRLSYMEQVGLGYLTLNRQASTLSGGEYQRIKLATALGSTLVDTLYILDEPTIGLHPRDTKKLVDILVALKNLGNTVIVVEHEEELMRVADQLIDIGPEAGSQGGELVFQGDWKALKNFNQSHTARYLNGIETIPVPSIRRKATYSITFKGIRENNLKDVDVTIPLGVLTVITGVSGSGKSTLVKKIIYPALASRQGIYTEKIGKFDLLEGDYDLIRHIEFVDQNPMGKSSRSNPVTYMKAYDPIRQLFAEQPLSQQRGYTPSYFSFNVEGGRCEACQGEGKIVIEMQFMADITLTCESCHGRRFKQEALEVKYKDKDIADVLEMTVDDAFYFFHDKSSIHRKLKPLRDVGLGYVTLGQPSSSLSGGEAQRLKLATYLDKSPHQEHTLFIFDEPTTGLHVHDISKLLTAINNLIHVGNSVLIIEHTVELIKCADWIIDLGPEGGEKGGKIMFSGTPEDMIKLKNNYTAKYLRNKLI